MSAVPITLDATEATAPACATSKDPDTHATQSAHPAHSAHPDALRLRAVSLWCEGSRSPAISEQLNVPERTIRAWLAEARADFQAEHGETIQEMIALAVERQLAIAAAAWQSYHRAVELEQLALDFHRAQVQQAHDKARALPPPPPRPSVSPARYLSVAMAAHREAARLAGCYDRHWAAPSAPSPSTSRIPAKTATAPLAPPSPWGTARAEGSDEKERSGRQAQRGAGRLGEIPAKSATAQHLAPSPDPLATGSRFPFRREAGQGVRLAPPPSTAGGQEVRSASPIPAKTAADAPPYAWQHIM